MRPRAMLAVAWFAAQPAMLRARKTWAPKRELPRSDRWVTGWLRRRAGVMAQAEAPEPAGECEQRNCERDRENERRPVEPRRQRLCGNRYCESHRHEERYAVAQPAWVDTHGPA